MARPDLIVPYDPAFLGDGFLVPMPSLRPAARARAVRDGEVFDYTHFSLVMDRDRRTAMLAANNIDAANKVQIGGGLTWKMDERVGAHQLGRETYDSNQIDKGHVVRREDVLWGSVAEARAANRATYFYSNASPQHKNFNQDEWKALEDWVLERATDLSYRLCVFTGPVFTDTDPTVEELPAHLRNVARAAQLPAAFWKVIVLRDSETGGDGLAAVGFAIKQSDTWNDLRGRSLMNLKVHQVTLQAIEDWTGLDFGTLRQVDGLDEALIALRTAAGDHPWPTIGASADIRWSGAARPALGLRTTQGSGGALAGEGGCGARPFDARAAIAALNADLVRMADATGPQEPEPAAPALRSSAEAPPEHPDVEAIVAAAPSHLRDRVARFARGVVQEAQVARGERPATDMRRVVGGGVVPVGTFLSCVCVATPGWTCTGVVVAPQVVLTAAHCGSTIDRIMAGGIMVMPNFDASARLIRVRHASVHPGYRRNQENPNDITVLILDLPSLIPPVRLATVDEIANAEAFDVVGFGYDDPSRPVGLGIKRRVTIDLPAVIARTPEEDMGQLPEMLGFNRNYEFVVGRKSLGKDSCNGDSGGPNYVSVDGTHKLAGITSRGTREINGRCGDGGIYVRPPAFLDWINTTAAAHGLPALNA